MTAAAKVCWKRLIKNKEKNLSDVFVNELDCGSSGRQIMNGVVFICWKIH